MKSRFIKLWNEDKGAALLFVAASIVLLMGLAAMGTDLAWFYLNSSRVQRAADAAALGGVIWMPGEQPTAFSTANSIALQNGYDGGPTDPTVTVTPATVPSEDNQLQVTISDVVPTFFLKVLGFDTMTITETAIAEYIPPLKLGSPENQFGNACDPEQSGCSGQANFWANIHGRYTRMQMGDAYGAHCRNNNDDESCNPNPIARAEGYLYGIESSGAFTLQFVDLAFHNLSGGENTGDQIRTGDRGCEDWGDGDADCGPTMIVNLYAPDPTPLDLSDNGPPVCTATVPPEPQVADTAAYNWETPDGQGCWTQSGAGTWVVQVQHQDPGSTDDRSGLNRYSIRSTSGQLFALRDFSIYNNADGSETEFYLADVPSFYAGKTFVIELYDPGESDDPGQLQVIGDDGTIWTDSGCTVYDRPNTSSAWNEINTVAAGQPCFETVDPQEYHDRWLKFEIELPGDYSCNQAANECWWRMNYAYPSAVNDTTTWRAFIVGNPIHLAS